NAYHVYLHCPSRWMCNFNSLGCGLLCFAVISYHKIDAGIKHMALYFNPIHGPNDEDSHIGDLGNVTPNKDGLATVSIKDSLIALFGHYSIIGHTVVVRKEAEDLGKRGNTGSEKTRNAGPHLGCGIIGIAK
uniref:Superoxide dismutase copper/zinc binding domain-containing protein n=1 Tax=Vombatus ursinus TaxID=29139 RepID=A0A4X2LTU9_VOMUR